MNDVVAGGQGRTYIDQAKAALDRLNDLQDVPNLQRIRKDTEDLRKAIRDAERLIRV